MNTTKCDGESSRHFTAVFVGPRPELGATEHQATLIAWTGDAGVDLGRLSSGQIEPNECIVSLESAQPGKSIWLLTRSESAESDKPKVSIVEDNAIDLELYVTTLRRVDSQERRAGQFTIRLAFFGVPSVIIGAEVHPIPPGRSTELVATLAAACPAAISSERLARFARPATSDLSANAVYAAVSRLRSFMSDIGASELIGSGRGGYYLNIPPTDIDLVRFEEDARAALADPGTAPVKELQALFDQWSGSPFPDSPNHLLGRWQSRLDETHARVSEALALARLRGGELGEAVVVCQDLLVYEPWRESIWGLLITALYRSGRTNDALASSLEAKRRLRDELGLEPGPSLANLEMMILTHDPALLSDVPFAALALNQARS